MKKLILSALLALSLALSLSACDSKSQFGGTYRGAGEFTFKSDGTVSAVIMGLRAETPYRVEGDQIKFHFPGGSDVVLIKMADGNLDGGALGKFVKTQ